MADIALSGAVRQNLISLQSTAELLSETQFRLSTGLKVSSAIDDPTAFYTARGLSDRAGDLENLLNNVSLGVESLRAADKGIESISSLIENAKAAASQALSTAVSYDENKGSVALTAGLTAATTLASAGLASDADSIAISVGGTDTALAVTSTTTVGELVSAIGAVEGVTAVADYSAGSIAVTVADGGSFSLSGATGTNAVAASFDNGGNGRSSRESYVETFNTLRQQITELASDSHYNGINLLKNDNLTVFFNADQSSSLKITGVDFTTTGLGIDQISANAFNDDKAVSDAIEQLDSALNALRDQASTFGSNLSVVEVRRQFTTSIINTLENGSSLLTLADTNEEGANLLALSTRQQLGTRSLSLANQAEQNVLRLF